MHPSDEHLPMWFHVARLEHESLEGWRKAQAPSLTLEGYMTQRVTSVETTVSRRAGGAISVTISVLAKKALDCDVNYFRLQRVGNRLYQRVEPSSPSS